jgi:hypothetical protein
MSYVLFPSQIVTISIILPERGWLISEDQFESVVPIFSWPQDFVLSLICSNILKCLLGTRIKDMSIIFQVLSIGKNSHYVGL